VSRCYKLHIGNNQSDTMTETTYYTASTTKNPMTVSRTITPTVMFPKSMLNSEQTTACNTVFIIAVLLYVFILIWGASLTNVGFYVVSTINVLLLITTYWMWKSSRKWFESPTARFSTIPQVTGSLAQLTGGTQDNTRN